MTRKKSKFLTFICSLIPGAGEMYLGFMKQGISIMTLTLVVFSVGGAIFPPLITFVAVLWFYSFFHTHNLNALPDEEFYAVEDEYFFSTEQFFKTEAAVKKHKKLTAILLIIFGASILWNVLADFIFLALGALPLPEYIHRILYRITRVIPQLVVGIGIIAAGISLIRNRKNELSSQE